MSRLVSALVAGALAAVALLGAPAFAQSDAIARGMAAAALAKANAIGASAVNASNLTSGTLGAGRLPLPAPAGLGGVFSKAVVSHQFLTGISSVDGSVSQAQPSAADITGLAASATTDTTNAANISSGTLVVGRGGSGLTTATAHGVLLGEGASAFGVTATGSAGQVLTSNGSSADPTFQAAGGGSPGGSTGQVQYNCSGSFCGSTRTITSAGLETVAGPAVPGLENVLTITPNNVNTANFTHFVVSSVNPAGSVPDVSYGWGYNFTGAAQAVAGKQSFDEQIETTYCPTLSSCQLEFYNQFYGASGNSFRPYFLTCLVLTDLCALSETANVFAWQDQSSNPLLGLGLGGAQFNVFTKLSAGGQVDTGQSFTMKGTSVLTLEAATALHLNGTMDGSGIISLASGNITTTGGGSIEVLGSSGFFYAAGVGKPAYTLNTTGANFGQISNISAHAFALGYGGQTTLGTNVISWSDNSGVAIGNNSAVAAGSTLLVKDATASTGATQLTVQGGAAAADATTNKLLRINAGGGTTEEFSVQGNGVINSAGVASVSCAANSVSLTTLVVTNGIVTHC